MAARAVQLFVYALASVLLSTAACAKDAADLLGKLHSWSATAGMAAQTWSREDVPTGYVLRTVQAARENIARLRQEVARDSDIEPDRRTLLLDRIGSVQKPLADMHTMILRGDRRGLAEPVQRLEAAMRAPTVR